MLSCGIVGLPNVGKSTLFNVLTRAKVAASNYPFCTIDPNKGIVPVPDPRLKAIAAIAQSEKVIPATTQFVDIAGLVKGASDGEGLGNQFLSHIRNTQAILHVVRCFDSEDITHISGKIDPLADIDIINTELSLKDLESVEKALVSLSKEVRAGKKEAIKKHRVLEKVRIHLNAGQAVRTLFLNPQEAAYLLNYELLTQKPILYVANLADNNFKDNDYLNRLYKLSEKEQASVLPICAAIESEISQLSEDERDDFLEALDLKVSGLDRLIRASYDLLNLGTYFTVGPKETRAWTIPKGSTALEAAGVIHTDFQRGFIRADVLSYEDYLCYQGTQTAKAAGKWRSEGKHYIVQEGDVIVFRFNV